jgi:hypothetical protein
MPDDDGPRRAARVAASLVVVALGLAVPAAAAAQSATLRMDYSRLEARRRLFGPGGSFRDTTFTRSYWRQDYLVGFTRALPRQLALTVQGQYSMQKYVDRDERSTSPFGLARLTGPRFGITATHRPNTSVQLFGTLGVPGDPVDPSGLRTLRNRTYETMVSGHVSPARLPRLDATWVRRRGDPNELSQGFVQERRNLRTAYSVGPLSMAGGWGDQAGGITRAATRNLEHWDASAGISLAPLPRTSLGVDYGYTRYVRAPQSVRPARSDDHVASLNAGWRPTATFDVSSYYRLQSTWQNVIGQTRSRNQEGSLFGSWRPNPVVSLQGGGGVRTARILGREELNRYASAVAGASGRIRRHWTGAVSVSHSVAWDPNGVAFGVSQIQGGSRFRVWKGFELSGDLGGSVNSDTIRDGRAVTYWTVGATVRPLRSFSATLSERSYRVGSGPDVAAASTRGRGADVRWTPWTGFELIASYNTTAVLPDNDPRSTWSRVNAGWSLLPNLRVAGYYTHTTSAQTNALVTLISGREVAGGTFTLGVGRRSSLSAGLNVVDPGTASQARQFDVSFVHQFGR